MTNSRFCCGVWCCLLDNHTGPNSYGFQKLGVLPQFWNRFPHTDVIFRNHRNFPMIPMNPINSTTYSFHNLLSLSLNNSLTANENNNNKLIHRSIIRIFSQNPSSLCKTFWKFEITKAKLTTQETSNDFHVLKICFSYSINVNSWLFCLWRAPHKFFLWIWTQILGPRISIGKTLIFQFIKLF